MGNFESANPCRTSAFRVYRCYIVIFVFWAAIVVDGQGQTFTKLADLTTATGYGSSNLIQGADGNLYGTMVEGGASSVSAGTVFQLTPSGTVNVIHNFCMETGCPDGATSYSGLHLASDGNFYGSTSSSAYPFNAYGTLFRITSSGTLTTLHIFCQMILSSVCTDGNRPLGPAMQGLNGLLYGTTQWGGRTESGGTVYRLNSDGTITTTYEFCALTNCDDGYQANGALIPGPGGNFYGSTVTGGDGSGYGTVFEITPAGALTTIYNAGNGDAAPGSLVRGFDGNLYGLVQGGANGYGAIFKLTPSGVYTRLYSFCSQANCADGVIPATLILAPDGNLYGVTTGIRTAKLTIQGTIFKISTSGVFTTLYTLAGGGKGSFPLGLILATDGNFYGITGGDGANKLGTAFKFSTHLRPFVSTVEPGGPVGSTVHILGNNLTGTSSVTFSGISAAFTVVSETEITATVPAGAMTGTVKVVTPGGTLNSNVAFQVGH